MNEEWREGEREDGRTEVNFRTINELACYCMFPLYVFFLLFVLFFALVPITVRLVTLLLNRIDNDNDDDGDNTFGNIQLYCRFAFIVVIDDLHFIGAELHLVECLYTLQPLCPHTHALTQFADNATIRWWWWRRKNDSRTYTYNDRGCLCRSLCCFVIFVCSAHRSQLRKLKFACILSFYSSWFMETASDCNTKMVHTMND